MPSSAPNVLLWGVSVSPYVRRVMIALLEKNVPYQQIEILPKKTLQKLGQTVPADFDAASPLGKIPAIKIDDFTLADSSVIIAYLDHKFPSGTPLYPAISEQLAIVLWFENYANTLMNDVIYKKIFFESLIKPHVLKQEPDQAVIDGAKANELPAILNYLDDALQDKKWIAGDNFSAADIAISTHLLSLSMTGFSIDPSKWSNLKIYMERLLERPSYEKIRAQ